MKQMYVITLDTGEYDDYNREVVFVTDDFDKGSTYVNKKNFIVQSLQEKVSAFYNNEMVQWNQDNPRPEKAGFNFHPIPKWRGDQVITKEMRDERQEIVLKNQLITEKANEPITQWSNAYTLFVKEWFKNHLTEQEAEMHQNNNDNRWAIEPVNWL